MVIEMRGQLGRAGRKTLRKELDEIGLAFAVGYNQLHPVAGRYDHRLIDAGLQRQFLKSLRQNLAGDRHLFADVDGGGIVVETCHKEVHGTLTKFNGPLRSNCAERPNASLFQPRRECILPPAKLVLGEVLSRPQCLGFFFASFQLSLKAKGGSLVGCHRLAYFNSRCDPPGS
jgi:hypothetical protein